MKILLLTQGSQGILALRNLFAGGVRPDDLIIRVCVGGENAPFTNFLDYLQLNYKIVGPGRQLEMSLTGVDLSGYNLLSISWKYLIRPEVYERTLRAINLHPGLLPEYKGCFSTPWSIINGEEYCGYTFHLLANSFDDGPILMREKIRIQQKDNAFTLNYKIMNSALSRLMDVLSLPINFCGSEQFGKGTYYPNVLPYGGVIPKNISDELRSRIVRATYFPPHKPRNIKSW